MTSTDKLDFTLTWHYVEKWAAAKPEAEAFVFGEQRTTWAGFKTLLDSTAKALLEVGVQPGDRVAMIAMPRTEFLPCFMAANKIGATWLGLSPKYTVSELQYILSDCQPKVLVSLNQYHGKDLVEVGETMVRALPCIEKVLMLEGMVKDAEDFGEFVSRPRPHLDEALTERASRRKPDEIALLMYTSGSTGRPKGVLHAHTSLIENVRVEVERFPVREDTRCLLHFPINHVAADVEIGFASVFAGATIVMMDRFHPIETLDLLEKERITMFGQVPAMYLMQAPTPRFAQTDWSRVETFIWSGATAPASLVKVLSDIAKKTGARLLNGYGSTELGGFVTYTQTDDDEETLCSTAGKIAEPFELRIVDDARCEVPDGQVGEIAVRGPVLMRGYLNKPDETAKVVDEEGWYYTDDVGWRDERGYLHLSGRKSEMFKSGGENVFPREVEDVLESHPAVLLSAVIGIPDSVYQEVGAAFVVIRPGASVETEELRAFCREKLANFKAPKQFNICPALPTLPNGKVDKTALKRSVNAAGVPHS